MVDASKRSTGLSKGATNQLLVASKGGKAEDVQAAMAEDTAGLEGASSEDVRRELAAEIARVAEETDKSKKPEAAGSETKPGGRFGLGGLTRFLKGGGNTAPAAPVPATTNGGGKAPQPEKGDDLTPDDLARIKSPVVRPTHPPGTVLPETQPAKGGPLAEIQTRLGPEAKTRYLPGPTQGEGLFVIVTPKTIQDPRGKLNLTTATDVRNDGSERKLTIPAGVMRGIVEKHWKLPDVDAVLADKGRLLDVFRKEGDKPRKGMANAELTQEGENFVIRKVDMGVSITQLVGSENKTKITVEKRGHPVLIVPEKTLVAALKPEKAVEEATGITIPRPPGPYAPLVFQQWMTKVFQNRTSNSTHDVSGRKFVMEVNLPYQVVKDTLAALGIEDPVAYGLPAAPAQQPPYTLVFTDEQAKAVFDRVRSGNKALEAAKG